MDELYIRIYKKLVKISTIKVAERQVYNDVEWVEIKKSYESQREMLFSVKGKVQKIEFLTTEKKYYYPTQKVHFLEIYLKFRI